MPDAAILNADDSNIDWSKTPAMDAKDFHDFGAQQWRYDKNGVYLKSDPTKAVRSPGDPKTMAAILASYGTEIFHAAVDMGVPPELIAMTIATETAIYNKSNFTGPRTFRWEAAIGTYSAGPMQVLETTARGVIGKLALGLPSPPHFDHKPAPTDSNPLYNGEYCIPVGAGVIKLNFPRTGLDPILVAAAYNAGSLQHATSTTPENPWGLVTFGDHLNRAAQWFGDACALVAQLRQGKLPGSGGVITGPPDVDPESTDPASDIVLRNLTREEADAETNDYEDSGASVIEIPEEGGFITLVISYDKAIADPDKPPKPPSGATGVAPPDINGFVICIDRQATQTRKGKGFARTIGKYQAFFDKVALPGLSGTAVERQGPGDNGPTGTASHVRLKAGRYPLFTHAGGSNKYRTFGFANPGGLRVRPWPAIRVGDTSARSGVLIHCAAGYLMSIGCINLSGAALGKATDDIEYFDSRAHVMALIKAMADKLGDKFPTQNNTRIANAMLIIRNEP